MKHTYKTQRVCAHKIDFDVEDGVIQDVKFHGGCNGNLKGLSVLTRGMKVEDAIEKLSGLTCDNRGTSCPDQLAIALSQLSK
ncbi:MAG: TIGR03905 family TSCPD domain-containing protein [Clostridiales Family XIII bacterium]|jgi:uncharacterized protein (TIGR03905 family)|nr:TIGR03905 family TSCPD domain-containing protein [Clostridiales Family XIII bacterium]